MLPVPTWLSWARWMRFPSPPMSTPTPRPVPLTAAAHNAQLTAIMGAALALTDPEVKAALGGNVTFFAVPAEEFVELELKDKMREDGVIRYGGGKCELIRIGALDNIDLVVGHHSGTQHQISVTNGSSNGFVNKMITFEGKAAHAAGSPTWGSTPSTRRPSPCTPSTCSASPSVTRTPCVSTATSRRAAWP